MSGAAGPDRAASAAATVPAADAVPVGEVILAGEAVLAAAGVPAPAADSLALLAHAWERSEQEVRRARLFGDPVPAAVGERLAALIERRSARVPLQHLTGKAHFRTLTLPVGPGVFLPRPETELVAQAALDWISARGLAAPTRVLDLCTGSGALGLAVAVEAPGTSALGVEADPVALGWARRSAAAVSAQLRAAGSSFLPVGGDAGEPAVVADICRERLGGEAHVVVSNPPYVVADGTTSAPEVVGHDPARALWGGGAEGMELPRRIIASVAGALSPGGLLVMEHADTQGELVRECMRAHGFPGPETRSDYTGRDRLTLAALQP